MKALVIEPSKVYQQMYQSMLDSHDIEVVFSPDGSKALSEIESIRFDIVYVTMHLADMEGTEFCKEFRGRSGQQQTPLIMVTSDNDASVTADALSSGATEIFHKNNFSDIDEYLSTLVNRISQENELQGNVLYLEDSIAIAQPMIYTLEELGLTVTHHTTAEEGLNAVHKQHFDLILTDIILEGKMSGFGLVRELRNMKGRNQAIPVLAVSGFDDTSRKIELLRAGANDYISKPVIKEELVARVSNLITNRQLLDKIEDQQVRLRDLALKDQLTSLYNRHYLMDIAPQKISEAHRHKIPLSFVLLDVDKFKLINDTYGHDTGDIVLSAMGELLKTCCRREDIVARFGGEEFVIILTHCDKENAIKKMDTLRETLAALKPANLDVTASFGVTSLAFDNESGFAELFSAADKAVYRAKDEGRNRVVYQDITQDTD